ncbi:MAG TPA: HPr family phosphocarrier protein [Beijerinckia sp.]|nr:HPr family phosphocarrier protein [Beijerinckia sp.]
MPDEINHAELQLGEAECCPECVVPEGAIARTLTIINRKGLHARATAKLVQCIDGFKAEVTVGRCGEQVGGTSIMGILTLGAGQGMTITVSAAGTEAMEALDAIEALVANRFGEDE